MAKTIKEIARDTGYSRTTVTLVINGRADAYRISERARTAIEAYIAEHGYRYNQAARSLKLARSQTIGFVVPDLANPFFARIMAGLERLCRASGFVLVTTSTGEDPEVENRALDTLIERGVDGIVLAPCAPRRADPADRRVPTVLIDRAFAGDTRPVITSDHFESARILTRRMIAAGAADIGFLCGNPANPSIGLRIAGFRAVAGEHGGTRFAVITADEDSEETGHRLVRQLLDERQALPQGLLVSSLLVFSGAMRAIRESRGAIPPGLVLGTFDYSELFEYMPNAIYAIRQDEEELAARSFACLAGLLRKEKVAEPRQIVETKLMRFGAASRG